MARRNKTQRNGQNDMSAVSKNGLENLA